MNRIWVKSIIVGCLYYLAARFGLALSFQPEYIAALWPPNAILLCALLVSPTRDWPFLILVVIPAELAADLPAGISLKMSFGFIISDWIEVLTGAILFQKFAHEPPHFKTLKQTFMFITCCTIIGPLVAAFPAAIVTGLDHNASNFWVRWGRWLMADSLTHLVFTSFLCLWIQKDTRKIFRPAGLLHYIELTILVVALMCSVIFILGGQLIPPPTFSALLYAPLPILLWATVRFGPRGISSAAVLITVTIIWSASNSQGLFSSLSSAENVINIQIYLMISIAPLLFLGSSIQERINAGADLHETHQRLFFHMENSPLAWIEWDNAFRVTTWSSSATRIFGWEAHEVLGKHFRDWHFFHEDEPAKIDKTVQILQSGQQTNFTGTNRNYRRDGSVIDCVWHNCGFYDVDGKLVALFSQVQDVTEQKKARAALIESESKFADLYDNAPDMYLTIDAKTFQITQCNLTLCKKLGYEKEYLIGKPIFQLYHPDCREELQRVFEAFQKTGEVYNAKAKVVRADGGIIHIILNASAMRDTNGKIMQSRSIWRDVTDHQAFDENLRQNQKMEAIGTLAGGVAHQFNNALSAITGNIELLRMALPENEHVSRFIKPMKRSIERMTQLTTQLLAYAKGGRYQTNILRITNLIRTTLSLIKHTLPDSIYIETDLPKELWQIKGDSTQIQLVITAVVANAREAIENSGRIRVIGRNEIIPDDTVDHLQPSRPGAFVKITIEDDGKGMDSHTMKRLFEPFFSTKFEGRGLGMAAAYGIVQNHGGWITAESKPEKGTAIHVFLPALENTPAEIEERSPKTMSGTSTILIIEDDQIVLEVNSTLLAKMGYTVLQAKNGEEALQICENHAGKIDLAILDIILPGRSGQEIYPLLIKTRPDLKVLVCSGYSVDGPAREILQQGAQGFIQKPFSINKLSAMLHDVLSQ